VAAWLLRPLLPCRACPAEACFLSSLLPVLSLSLFVFVLFPPLLPALHLQQQPRVYCVCCVCCVYVHAVPKPDFVALLFVPSSTAAPPLVSAVQQGCVVPTWHRTSNLRRLPPPTMASLSFIMDVNDDSQTDGRPPLNKRDRGTNKSASAGPVPQPPSNPRAGPSHASSPGLPSTEQDIKRAVPAGQTKRRGGPKSSSTAPTSGTDAGAGTGASIKVPSSSSPSPSLSASTARQSTRRPSTTSTDSMDRSRYGSVPSSSSMAGGLQRPLPPYPSTPQFAPKITPKTGRVSKAKKGLPVHICEICRPPKVRRSSGLLCLPFPLLLHQG
jgi:hypothetical protein